MSKKTHEVKMIKYTGQFCLTWKNSYDYQKRGYISTIRWHKSGGNNMKWVWRIEMNRYERIIKLSSYLGEDVAISLKKRLTINMEKVSQTEIKN